MTSRKYKKMLMAYGLYRNMAAVLCMAFSSVCSLYGGKQEEFRKRTDWNRCRRDAEIYLEFCGGKYRVYISHLRKLFGIDGSVPFWL